MATQLADNPTRQQLDELDALLQKMLALPSNPNEATSSSKAAPKVAELKQVPPTVPPPPPPAPKFPKPEVAFGLPPAAAFVADSPAPTPAAPKNEPSRGWSIDLNPRGSSSVLGSRSPLAEGGATDRISDVLMPPAPLQLRPAEMTPLDSSIDTRRRGSSTRDVSFLMRPFAATTAWFDDMFAGFGPIGRLMSSAFIRDTMGFCGLTMLGGSAIWVALAWIGWTR